MLGRKDMFLIMSSTTVLLCWSNDMATKSAKILNPQSLHLIKREPSQKQVIPAMTDLKH